jgi:hypothetical protein
MKKLHITILMTLFLCLGVYAQRQTGIYMTVDDFKNGNLIKDDGNSLQVKATKHIVTMKVKGEEKEFKCSDIFGMLVNGKLLRFIQPTSALACELTMYTDNYCWWRFTHTSIYADRASTQSSSTDYISSKVDGELVFIGMGSNVKKLAEHKGFEPLIDCINAGKKKMFMMQIGDCMAKDPTWKQRVEDAIPPIK